MNFYNETIKFFSDEDYNDVMKKIKENCDCVKCDKICSTELIQSVVTISAMKNHNLSSVDPKHRRSKKW